MVKGVSDGDYERLLRFRTGLRSFTKWSERQARAAGLTPAQHQLLLAVRGHPGGTGPTITDVAGYLHLRHHSAVELVDRAVAAGLVRRVADRTDRRLVRLDTTPRGSALLERLTAAHLTELSRLGATEGLWRDLDGS